MPFEITSEIVVAYAQCPRKAYLLLYSPEQGEPHEYVRMLLANPQGPKFACPRCLL
jgi:hypothetical protein